MNSTIKYGRILTSDNREYTYVELDSTEIDASSLMDDVDQLEANNQVKWDNNSWKAVIKWNELS